MKRLLLLTMIVFWPSVLLAESLTEYSANLRWQASEEFRFECNLEPIEVSSSDPNHVSDNRKMYELSFTGCDGFKLKILWDSGSKVLYADLNDDGDLYTEPQEAIKARQVGRDTWVGMVFYDVDLIIKGRKYRFRIETEEISKLQNYGGMGMPGMGMPGMGSQDYAYSDEASGIAMFLKSGYAGSINVDGFNLEFELIDFPDGQVSEADQVFLGRQTAEHLISGDDNSEGLLFDVDMFPVYSDETYYAPKEYYSANIELFFNSKSFNLEYSYASEEANSNLLLTLNDNPVATGQLNLKGRMIETLKFTQGDSTYPERIIWPEINEICTVPVGTLNCQKLELINAKGKTIRPESVDRIKPVIIKQDVVSDFQAGAPLNSTVKMTKIGLRSYEIDYQLQGIGGETYDPHEITGYKEPEFAAYMGAVKVNSGTFDYG